MTETPGTPPAVQAYLQALGQGLKPLPPAEREDVLREITAHIEDGVAAGESPAAVIGRLGAAADVAGAMVEERLVTVDKRRSPGELTRLVVKAAWRPFWVAMITMLAVMEANTLYLYAGWITEYHTPWSTMLRLLALSLPAIIVVTVPAATLYLGLCGIPKLAGELSRPLFRRLSPKLILAVLGLGLVASGLGFVLNDTVVIPSNRATVDLQRTILATAEHWTDFGPRSPQEMTFSELSRHIADVRQRPDSAEQVGRLVFDYQSKLALPAAAFATSALGLALGFALARRQPLFLLGQVAIGMVAIMSWYVAYSFARGASLFSGIAAIGAWMPDLATCAAALIIGGATYFGKRETVADV